MLLKNVEFDQLKSHSIYLKGLGNKQNGTLVYFLVSQENTGFCVWRVDFLDGMVPPGGQMMGFYNVREDALEAVVEAVVKEKVALYGTEI